MISKISSLDAFQFHALYYKLGVIGLRGLQKKSTMDITYDVVEINSDVVEANCYAQCCVSANTGSNSDYA